MIVKSAKESRESENIKGFLEKVENKTSAEEKKSIHEEGEDGVKRACKTVKLKAFPSLCRE